MGNVTMCMKTSVYVCIHMLLCKQEDMLCYSPNFSLFFPLHIHHKPLRKFIFTKNALFTNVPICKTFYKAKGTYISIDKRFKYF